MRKDVEQLNVDSICFLQQSFWHGSRIVVRGVKMPTIIVRDVGLL